MQADSIVDASEDAQLEAAIQASLKSPTPSSSVTTTSMPTYSSSSPLINLDSGSECGSDDLETFTDSDDEVDKQKGKFLRVQSINSNLETQSPVHSDITGKMIAQHT